MTRFVAGMAWLALQTACAEPRDVAMPGSVADGGARFADTVIAFAHGNEPLTTCTDALPACGQPMVGACAGHAAVGADDGVLFELGAGGRLDLAFRCDAIRERGPGGGGGASEDFRVHATLADGASAVVAVSEDGSVWRELALLAEGNQDFELERVGVEVVSFVRVVDLGSGGISVDAVEAL